MKRIALLISLVFIFICCFAGDRARTRLIDLTNPAAFARHYKVKADNLVAYWNAVHYRDGGSTAQWNDIANGLNDNPLVQATAGNQPSLSTSGPRSRVFDGTDDFLTQQDLASVTMTAAASGSNGIQVADDDNIDFGTGNFTLVWRGSLPDWTPSATLDLLFKDDMTSGVEFYIESDSTVGYYNRTLGIPYTSTVANSLVDNTTHEIVASITQGTSVLFYIDGIQFGDSVAIGSGSISSTSSLFVSGTGAKRTAGTCHFAATYNRALTAAEVLSLYRNGIDFADKWGANILSSYTKWREVAPKLGAETYIYSLAVYNSKLYGGTAPNGKLYEWNDANAWVEVAPQLGAETYIFSLAVYNGKLYGGTAPNGKLYEWNDANAWVEVAPQLGAETRILSLTVYNSKLYGGTYPNGKLYEWNDANAWVEVAPKLGAETYIYSLAVYNSKLYGGTYPNGKLYGAGLGATLALEGEGIRADKWYGSANALDATYPVAGCTPTPDPAPNFNLTGSFTYWEWLKPADGQPAADQVLFAKGDYASPNYAYGLKLKTTGKLEAVLSADGTTATGKVTDAAVYADGAQTSFNMVAVIYDATGQTVTFYNNGSSIASSNLGGGGPPASIKDVYRKFTLGASSVPLSYYAGSMGGGSLVSRALSAAEIANIYNRDKGRF